jgi:hypothetical protein
MSEITELDSGSLTIMMRIYPRESIRTGLVARYADAMRMGAIMPPPVVATIEGKYVVIDGVHRIRAMELLSGMKHGNVKVELLGEMTEEQAFEEAVRRNAIHGSTFVRDDLRRIVQTFEKYGRDMTYASEMLKMSRDRLDFTRDAQRAISYPSGKKEKKEEASPLGMGLDELISWTIKFVRDGKVGEESIDRLTQLRDEINDFLEKRRKAMKEEREERAVVMTEVDEKEDDAGAVEAGNVIRTDSTMLDEKRKLLRNALDVLERAKGVPLTAVGILTRMRNRDMLGERRIHGNELIGLLKSCPDVVCNYYSGDGRKRKPRYMLRKNAEAYMPLFLSEGGGEIEEAPEGEEPEAEENAAGRGITVDILAGAMRAYYSSRGEKRDDDFKAEAWHVLSFFGQNGQCYDNSLEAEDRQMMYELENMGYVRSESQDITLHDSKPWRMMEWFLVPARILEAYDSLKEEKQELIYENLPEEVWAR